MNKIFVCIPCISLYFLPFFKHVDIKKVAHDSAIMSFWSSVYEINSNFYIKESIFKTKFNTLFFLNIDSINCIKVKYIDIRFLYNEIKTLMDKGNEVYITIDYKVLFLSRKISFGVRITNG